MSSLLILAIISLRTALVKYTGAKWYYCLWATIILPQLVLCFPIHFQNRFTVVYDIYAITTPYTQAMTQASAAIISPQCAFLIWLFGVITCMGFLTFLNLRFTSNLKQNSRSLLAEELYAIETLLPEISLQKLPPLRITNLISSPMISHITTPIIYLPVNFFLDYTQRDQKYMLQHELVHYQRYDLLANTVMLIFNCLNWFNPVMYFTYKHFRGAQELSCDAMVSHLLSPAEKKAYGYALLKTISQQSTDVPVMSCSWGKQSQIKERFNMLKFHNTKRVKSLLGAAILVASACTAIAAPTVGRYLPEYSNPGIQYQADIIRSEANSNSSMLLGNVLITFGASMKMTADKVMVQFKNDKHHKADMLIIYGEGTLDDGAHRVKFLNGSYNLKTSQLNAEKIIQKS